MSSRQIILDRIRKALETPQEMEYPKPDMNAQVFVAEIETDLALVFARNLTAKAGQLYYVENYEDFYATLSGFLKARNFQHICCWEPEVAAALDYLGQPYSFDDAELKLCDASITLCEALAARTGSILVSSAQAAGRRLTIYPPVHIVVASISQLKADIGEALAFVKDSYAPKFPSMISLISGPSRTADIEKTLVMGAHGPKELILFLVDDQSA